MDQIRPKLNLLFPGWNGLTAAQYAHLQRFHWIKQRNTVNSMPPFSRPNWFTHRLFPISNNNAQKEGAYHRQIIPFFPNLLFKWTLAFVLWIIFRRSGKWVGEAALLRFYCFPFVSTISECVYMHHTCIRRRLARKKSERWCASY